MVVVSLVVPSGRLLHMPVMMVTTTTMLTLNRLENAVDATLYGLDAADLIDSHLVLLLTIAWH